MGYRQLLMEAPLDVELPEIGSLPEHDGIHAADASAKQSFDWIMRNTFHGVTYERMTEDPTVAPERTFFYSDFDMDVGTATARIMPDGVAKLHMVAVDPAYTGKGISYKLCLTVMKTHQALGFKSCRLETDDFRLSAIKTYLSLGFKPLYEAGDTEMEERWAKVLEKIAAYKKKDNTPFPIYNGIAPDSEVCGDQGQPTLTPYTVDGSKGAVIVCPGGGYSMLARYEGEPIARMIASAGISSFVLKYRVQPFTSLETPIGDAKRAIRLVRSMGYEKVAILGFSAGGHLSAMAATKWDNGNPDAEDPVERLSSRPDAFIPCYGACSMSQFRKSGWMKQLFGDEANNYKKLIEYSAECLVTPETPPAFIWQTADDPVVVVNNALLLANALSANGVRYEMHLFPHGPHGVAIGAKYPDTWEWPDLCKAFLLRLGFGKEIPDEASDK